MNRISEILGIWMGGANESKRGFKKRSGTNAVYRSLRQRANRKIRHTEKINLNKLKLSKVKVIICLYIKDVYDKKEVE